MAWGHQFLDTLVDRLPFDLHVSGAPQRLLRGSSVNPALSSCRLYISSTQQSPLTPSCSVDFPANVSITILLPLILDFACQSPGLKPLILPIYLSFTLYSLQRFSTRILSLKRTDPSVVLRSLLLEKSGRCTYSKQSNSSSKALCMGQALKKIKATSSESRRTTRAIGNLENR